MYLFTYIKPRRVFCSECKYFDSNFIEECLSPNNIFTYEKCNYKERKIYKCKRCSSFINSENNCEWFEKK